MEKEAQLLDNVETSWRGVQDMTVSESNDMLLGLSATTQQFSIYCCPLGLINLDGERVPKKPTIFSRQGPAPVTTPPTGGGSYAGIYQQQRQSEMVQKNIADVQFNIDKALQNINQINLDPSIQERIYQQQQQFMTNSTRPPTMHPNNNNNSNGINPITHQPQQYYPQQ
jgi:katanin p80 WD40 repeat-containing subunit B1